MYSNCTVLCDTPYIGAVIGFANLGEINSHLIKFEESTMHSELGSTAASHELAKSMLVIMVKGLFTHLDFPYTQPVPLYHSVW